MLMSAAVLRMALRLVCDGRRLVYGIMVPLPAFRVFKPRPVFQICVFLKKRPRRATRGFEPRIVLWLENREEIKVHSLTNSTRVRVYVVQHEAEHAVGRRCLPGESYA